MTTATVYVIKTDCGFYGGRTLEGAKVFKKPGPPRAIVTKWKKRFKNVQTMTVIACTLTLGEPV